MSRRRMVIEASMVAVFIAVAVSLAVVHLDGGTRATPPPAKASDQEPLRLQPATRALAAGHHARLAGAQSATGHCGAELWSIKTLADPAAGAVDLTPVPRTIAELAGATAPPSSSTRPRDAPVETTTWRIVGTLTGYKLEGDSDVHLVVSSAGKTMIAELPDPACAAGSRVAEQIAQARAAFLARYSLGSECFGCLSQPVVLDGVGFFDFLHGQNGVAENGVELHPVLAVSFGVGPPPPPTTTTLPTTATTTTTPARDADRAEDARECPTFIPASDKDLRDDIHERRVGICPPRR